MFGRATAVENQYIRYSEPLAQPPRRRDASFRLRRLHSSTKLFPAEFVFSIVVVSKTFMSAKGGRGRKRAEGEAQAWACGIAPTSNLPRRILKTYCITSIPFHLLFRAVLLYQLLPLRHAATLHSLYACSCISVSNFTSNAQGKDPDPLRHALVRAEATVRARVFGCI